MLTGHSRAVVVLLVLAVVGMIGCVPIPRSYTKEQLLGEYRIQYPFGVDTLILRPDNTYEQHFINTSGETFEHRGRWEFKGGRDNQVDLLDAVDVCDGFGKFASTEPQSGHSFRTFGWYGSIVISINEDAGFYMRRVR
jgi:hypothetical protein